MGDIERDRRMAELSASLDTKQREFAALQAQLRKCKIEIDQLSTAVSTAKDPEQRIEAQLAECTAEIRSLKDEQRKTIEQLRNYENKLRASEGARLQWEAEKIALAGERDLAVTRCAAIENSTTWRLSAPARWAALHLRSTSQGIRTRCLALPRRATNAYRFLKLHGFREFGRVVRKKLRKDLISTIVTPQNKNRLLASHSFVTAPPAQPIADCTTTEERTINWFIPNFGFGSGGHLNIFRFIYHLEQRGFSNNVVIVGDDRPSSPQEAREQIRAWFFPITARVVIGSDSAPQARFNFATSWQTAYHLRAHATNGHKLYFVQDFEPYFYPHGSDYTFAEATYKFGFVGITAGSWLSQKLSTQFGMTTFPIGFSYDQHLYVPHHRRQPDIKRLFFYARPPTVRRGFELGLLTVARVVERLPDVKVIFAGWDVSSYEIPFEHLNAGSVALKDLPDLYSQCDVALILSFSNLSLLPLEVMACETPYRYQSWPQCRVALE